MIKYLLKVTFLGNVLFKNAFYNLSLYNLFNENILFIFDVLLHQRDLKIWAFESI